MSSRMRSHCLWSIRIIFAFCSTLLGSTFASATSPAFVSPDFEIQVLLSDTAKRYLFARDETVAMTIEFADSVGPGGRYLGVMRYEAPGNFLLSVRNLEFDPIKIRALRTQNYQVVVNVSSGRRDLPDNVLDCGFIQDAIQNLQQKSRTVKCELGSWAPR